MDNILKKSTLLRMTKVITYIHKLQTERIGSKCYFNEVFHLRFLQ